MNCEIRFATFDDVPEVLAIATEGELSPWTEQDYVAEVHSDDSLFFVASEFPMSAVIGFILGRFISNNDALDAEIHNIGVSKFLRRHGIGTALFARFLEHCGQKNVKGIWLEVRSKNKTAKEFYEGFGFKTKYVRKGYYRDPIDDANVMHARISEQDSNLLERASELE